MDSRIVGENAPWLYEEGDTKFPGGIIRHGLIVAASGLDWQYDEACSEMVASLFWASVRRTRDQIMREERITVR
jgi:hypothetical protein